MSFDRLRLEQELRGKLFCFQAIDIKLCSEGDKVPKESIFQKDRKWLYRLGTLWFEGQSEKMEGEDLLLLLTGLDLIKSIELANLYSILLAHRLQRDNFLREFQLMWVFEI